MEKGRCYICNNIYQNNGVTRHIKSCLKKTKEAEIDRGNNDNTYLIKVTDRYNFYYYLYLMVDKCVLLNELDQYLKEIWVECCGHLSNFTIDQIRYEKHPDYDWKDTEDMNVEIGRVLTPGTTFSYTYDYGSSTELELKVMEEYKPLFDEKGIYLLGRNMPLEHKCEFCSNKAEVQFIDLNYGAQGFLCNSCEKNMQSEEGEEVYFSNIINSPRVGVCGYDGPADDIMFMKHNMVKDKKRNKKNETKRYDSNNSLMFIEDLIDGKLSQEDIEQHIDYKKIISEIANLVQGKDYFIDHFMIEGEKLDNYMLKDLLSLLRKKELEVIRKELGIENASGLIKSKLIERINSFLLDNIVNILTFMPLIPYRTIMEIYKSEEAFWVEGEDVPETLEDLRSKGLLFTTYEDEYEDDYKCVIPDDIKIVIKRLLGDIDFQEKRAFTDNLSKAIISILYYWGIVEKHDILKETARLLEKDIDKEFIVAFETFFKNIEPYIEEERIDDTSYYSILAEDIDIKVSTSQWQLAEYPLITKDMLPERNEGLFDLILHNPYLYWMYDVLERGRMEGFEFKVEPSGMITNIAYTTMNIETDSDIDKLCKELEMQEETVFVKEFLNNILLYTPNYWIKGNSISGEIHVNNKKYKGWKPQAIHVENPAKSSQKSSVEAAALRWKVGRNDQCPCGSGKKFKNCCSGTSSDSY